jgi:superfamily I DNA/RNA helicase
MPDLLIGGPGTGKTTSLVNEIRMKQPANFAFLTFTRQAAQEAQEKLKFTYAKRELDYVRTIHSLAFKLLNLHKGSIFDFKHQIAFGKEYGYEFSGKYRDEEDGTSEGLTNDDIVFRSMLVFGTQSRVDDAYDYEEIHTMKKRYDNFKQFNDLLDFNDLLIRCIDIKQINAPHFDLLCVDEAQDLSPLQWAVINKLVENSKHVIYAGDDDQMIYEWAGVKREYFQKVVDSSQMKVLEVNHRLPVGIFLEAGTVISRCKNRIEKATVHVMAGWAADNHRSIERIEDLYSIEKFNSNETYLILVRNAYLLNDVKFILNELGLDFTYLHYRDNGGDRNIKLSTIHGSKGAEADNVILFTDVSGATYENITRDSEHRVWYVGMTRARKRLYIVEPRGELYYDL